MLLFVNVFIKRPVLTTVCALIIAIVGAIAGTQLPISQLPEIAPTQVQVTSTYIGADAKTVENTVTSILEREVNGVEGMKYIESNSSNNGLSQITVTFDASANPDFAQVNVQNRVASAEPKLPEAVKQTGVITEKASSNLLIVFGFYAEDNLYDDIFISNYIDLFVIDSLKRVEGVGQAVIFGERKYAMRVWVDPNALISRGLTAQDVVNALREQNVQIGLGAIGQQPAPADQEIQLSLRVQGRLQSVQEFENIVVKTNDDGSLVKLKDVGRAELGAENYDSSVQLRGNPGVGVGIYQLPGSNALEVAHLVKEKITELEANFPPGLRDVVAFDTTEFVETSLTEVAITLLQAIALVILILFVFLQDWRATLIPAVTIPVSLIGTLAFLKIFNFEINTLTLFGMVLATGIVVDDAIVIVEAVATKIEQGQRPRQAAIEAMGELSGAVLATSVVLMAVFIPVAFFPGTTGKIYQQFALTIAFAIAISTFNALTFSPSMAALLLRSQREYRGPLGWFFGRFNATFGWITRRYRAIVERLSHVRLLVLGLFVVALGLTVFMYRTVPSAFIPEEDQGYFLGIVQTPEGVSLNYTQGIMDRIDTEMQKLPEVKMTFAISGFGFDGSAPNKGLFFGTLVPWEERRKPQQSVYGILGRLNPELQKIPGALIFALNAPPVQGLSNFGGFEFQLQDRSGGRLGIGELVENAYGLMGAASEQDAIAEAFTQFTASAPQIQLELDRDKAKSLNVNIDEALSTLGTYLGSQYVNDFTYGSRSYRVYVQADQQFRSTPSAINNIYIRSQDNRTIPFSNLVQTAQITGPQTITHFNLFRSVKLQGQAAPGFSSGQAIGAMERAYQAIASPALGYEWMGTALEEQSSGGQAPIIFGLGLVMVFLVLAAQYENYIDPLIIMLSVPLALLGALLFLYFRGLNLDVYAQVGLVMLIGLASKNAILIVEFANQRLAEGESLVKAAVEAGEQRFRPILMTAISSLVGFFPLVIATGAGSASRWSIGTVVFGGLLVATVLTLFLVPILLIAVKQLEHRLFGKKEVEKAAIENVEKSPSVRSPDREATTLFAEPTSPNNNGRPRPQKAAGFKPPQPPLTQLKGGGTMLNDDNESSHSSTQSRKEGTTLNDEGSFPTKLFKNEGTGLNRDNEDSHPTFQDRRDETRLGDDYSDSTTQLNNEETILNDEAVSSANQHRNEGTVLNRDDGDLPSSPQFKHDGTEFNE